MSDEMTPAPTAPPAGEEPWKLYAEAAALAVAADQLRGEADDLVTVSDGASCPPGGRVRCVTERGIISPLQCPDARVSEGIGRTTATTSESVKWYL